MNQLLSPVNLVRAGLVTLVAGGAALAIVLSAGAADPPRAGPLQLAGQRDSIPLPAAPYTLEAACTLPPEGDPLAWWGVQLEIETGGEAGTVLYSAQISADAYFRLPPFQPDATEFHHIRPPGQANEIVVSVAVSGAAEVRVNHEIAWRGQLALATLARIVGCDGNMALYAP